MTTWSNMNSVILCCGIFCFIPEDKWGSFILSDHIGNFNIVKIEWDCQCWTIYTCWICKLITIWLWNDHRLLLHLHHYSLCCSDYQNMDTGILDFSTQFRLNLSFKIHVIYITLWIFTSYFPGVLNLNLQWYFKLFVFRFCKVCPPSRSTHLIRISMEDRIWVDLLMWVILPVGAVSE